jgi:hypothetical protein
MKKWAILGASMLLLLAGCGQPSGKTETVAPEAGTRFLGEVTVTIQGSSSVPNVEFAPSAYIPDASVQFFPGLTERYDTANGKFVTASFGVRNLSGMNLRNLTMLAYHKAGNLDGTGVAVFDPSGMALPDAGFDATALIPSHGMRANGTVNSQKANLQVFRESELANFTSQYLPNVLLSGNFLLGYGFLVRNTGNGALVSGIGPSRFTNNTAVAFQVPDAAALTNTYKLSYLLFTDATEALTESTQEQILNSLAGRTLPSVNIAALPKAKVLKNSTYAGANRSTVCNVRIAGANVISPAPVYLGQTMATTCPAKVSLAVSANTGTETAETVITVTATTDSDVDGAQTVNLGVSGMGITATDYQLASTTLTIPDGGRSATTTFKVLNDNVAEVAETVTISLNTPSSGLMLGMPSSQDIQILDAQIVSVSPGNANGWIRGNMRGNVTNRLVATPSRGINPGSAGFDSQDSTGRAAFINSWGVDPTRRLNTLTALAFDYYIDNNTSGNCELAPVFQLEIFQDLNMNGTPEPTDNFGVLLYEYYENGTMCLMNDTWYVDNLFSQKFWLFRLGGAWGSGGYFGQLFTLPQWQVPTMGLPVAPLTAPHTYITGVRVQTGSGWSGVFQAFIDNVVVGFNGISQTTDFGNSSSTPTVSVTITPPSTGTEAASTPYTITATASAPVATAQTVTLSLSGTAVAADLTGFTPTITIPAGMTTGTTSFSINNDAISELIPEQATFSVASVSSGLLFDLPTNFSITIVSDE